MSEQRYQGAWCSKCGHDMTLVPYGQPCPLCGHPYRTHGMVNNTTAKGTASMSKTVGKTVRTTAKGTASMSWVHVGERVRDYWEKHPVWFVLNGVLVLGSPFLGLLKIVGWEEVLVGEAVGLLSLWVGTKASTKVREKTRGEIARGGAP